MARNPDLIVPLRDRRRRKRILTLKNFGIAIVAVIVVFAVITIRSEMRDPDQGSFGQLYSTQLPAVDPNREEPVTEAVAVPEQTHADPMLVAPAARSQWLIDEETQPVTSSTIATGETRAEAAVVSGETRVAIVGGSEGVAVVKRTRREPELSGGFGRQQ